MPKSPEQISLHLRTSSARALCRAAYLLFEVDALTWDEYLAARHVFNTLAKRGELPREPERRLLDLHQVAEKLAIAESTLKRLLAEGSINLPKVRIGGNVRFRLADVEALVDNVSED